MNEREPALVTVLPDRYRYVRVMSSYKSHSLIFAPCLCYMQVIIAFDWCTLRVQVLLALQPSHLPFLHDPLVVVPGQDLANPLLVVKHLDGAVTRFPNLRLDHLRKHWRAKVNFALHDSAALITTHLASLQISLNDLLHLPKVFCQLVLAGSKGPFQPSLKTR